jgi:hypothetical protein
MPKTVGSLLAVSLSLWGLAAFFCLSGFGAIFGWALGLFALWPTGVLLQTLHPMSKIKLTMILFGVAAMFFGLSTWWLEYLVSSGYR